MKNILLVVSGPSGVGKGTLVERLMRSGQFALSVSCTTRKPRPGESEGKSYFFLSREEFETKISRGEFLEYDEHFGNYYGTPRSFVEETLKKSSVLLEIDVVGALNVKKNYPSAVLVMIAPPSEEELERRLKGRGTEEEDSLKERIARAKFELEKGNLFDYTLVNADLKDAEKGLLEIVKKEKSIG